MCRTGYSKRGNFCIGNFRYSFMELAMLCWDLSIAIFSSVQPLKNVLLSQLIVNQNQMLLGTHAILGSVFDISFSRHRQLGTSCNLKIKYSQTDHGIKREEVFEISPDGSSHLDCMKQVKKKAQVKRTKFVSEILCYTNVKLGKSF